MLVLKSLSKHFGGVRAVDGLDLEVEEGEIFGLIGPNGSGKSTTVNLICGVFPVTAGEVLFKDRDITHAQPHVCLAAGIARTFQNIRLFGHLSVWQNLWVAQNALADRKSTGFVNRWFSGSRQARADTEALLDFAGLGAKADDLAGNLSFGEQRRLELARALAAKPTMLLLDEPAAGMNVEEVGALRERLHALRDDGKTILLVEHVMELVMGVTDRIAVLNFGQKIAEGTPDEIQNDKLVREAYLGTSGQAGQGDA
ncbi:MAG: ABC transporter ATP-binding protein [Defluviicoccus sp.]|nr:ABC transporter ATP-binding protein [Defluviicoccus sp.]MDE0382348.1 ABC transporter ATP-binding protein [Defluviicoccus sp.]